MEQLDLKDIIDLGMTGILLFINRDLWSRLNELQDRLFRYLDDGRRSRKDQSEKIEALQQKVDAMSENDLNTPKTPN